MRKTFSLMGSPRKNKNTDFLLKSFLIGIGENGYPTTKIDLIDKKVSPCTGCGCCQKKGECIIDDDMSEIYNQFESNDIIIISSPLYFNTVNGMIKNVIDRCQKYWSQKYVLRDLHINKKEKIGIFLSVGGAEFSHGQFEACIPTIDLFFKSIGAKYKGNYFVSGTDRRPIWDRNEILEEAHNIGKNIDDIENFYLHR